MSVDSPAVERILWIGPKHMPPDLRALLIAQGVEIITFDAVDPALKATQGLPISVAIIIADVKDCLAGIPRFARARPEVQVIAATEAGLTRQISYALRAGASGAIDLRGQYRTVVAHQVKDAIGRFHQAARERELLLRLRSLNEEFLKNIVAAERRNIELEDERRPTSELLAIESDPSRVLVVDDEAIVSQVLEVILKRRGHHFVSVATGEEAVEQLKATAFHLIITDKNLPGISGLDVMREAKKLSPDTNVIMMTGYANTESAVEALNLGAVAYLEKPFDQIQTVGEKIEAALAHQRERMRKRHYLRLIKDRNRVFLEQYKTIRADLEAWLQNRGVRSTPAITSADPAKR